MTIEEAQAIIAKTTSSFLKRDMQKFINRQRKKEAAYGKAQKGNQAKRI